MAADKVSWEMLDRYLTELTKVFHDGSARRLLERTFITQVLSLHGDKLGKELERDMPYRCQSGHHDHGRAVFG